MISCCLLNELKYLPFNYKFVLCIQRKKKLIRIIIVFDFARLSQRHLAYKENEIQMDTHMPM